MISLLTLALVLGTASAGVSEGFACLREADLACAVGERDAALKDDPDATETRQLVAMTYFYEGRYTEAAALAKALEDQGAKLAFDAPIQETAEATKGFLRARGRGVEVRYARGLDIVLVEEAIETLEKARQTIDPLLGGGPDHTIVVDIFPDGKSFIASSGLPEEAVRTTGVVALSKWTRLLVTSPRALSRGYAWKDTVVHEYIHLVVAWRTRDRCPVWLQEGLAKHLEGWWRGETTGHLSAYQQSLLAGAVHTGGFVPFEKFKHSMAYLDSGEEAALAFSQVATMVAYLLTLRGPEALPGVLDAVREGEDAGQAVSSSAGFSSFEAFREGWINFVRGLPLVSEQLSSLPVVLDGSGTEYADDPLLSARTDLARYARLGDLLREQDRCRAALVEYTKADDPQAPPSPSLLARKAECYGKLGDRDQALTLVTRGVQLYPEFTLLQTTYASLLESAGRTGEAQRAWLAAHDLNPFNPAVQAAIVRTSDALGDKTQSERHKRYAQLLMTGGMGEGR